MNKLKQAAISLAIFFIFLIYYYCINKSNNVLKTNKIWNINILSRVQNNRYLVETKGCKIPDYYEEFNYKNISIENSCGQRAIFVKKMSDRKIKFQIDRKGMKNYLNTKEKYTCCYQTVNRSRIGRGEDNYLNYSPCINFKSGTTVKIDHELIKVNCTVYYNNKSDAIFYDDVFIKLRKVNINYKVKTKAWNVLLLGMDSMSRTRFFKTMPRTSNFIRRSGWLDYKGYHAISFENFYNLMAILTGENKISIDKKCEFGLDYCINETLWAKFQETGYVTAYGENFVNSESFTFASYYGFTSMPTDHYMKPLFLSGETREGNILCTKKKPSVNHLLDYAFQFLDAYKKDKHFGLFWHKPYSNTGSVPNFIDNAYAEFFDKIYKSSILDNTFILFMSNHGITHGVFKIPVTSYYESRLPMLFIWVPYNFRKTFPKKYRNLQINQNGITSPYDVFVTLSSILKLSSKSPIIARSNACSNCMSFFEEISTYRSCSSVGMEEKFCTCHNVMEIDGEQGAEAVDVAVSYIKELTGKVDTIPFSTCAKLKLDRVLRINGYTSHGKEYVIAAFTMIPGNNSFEALLMRYENQYHILEPIDGLSGYNKRGSCAINSNDRPYCVCEMSSPCVA